MFSKSRINETTEQKNTSSTSSESTKDSTEKGVVPSFSSSMNLPRNSDVSSSKPKPKPSLVSSDLHIKGDLRTSGDVEIQGQVDGDIEAHTLIVGENAKIRGEILGDDIVINGHINGCVRGLKIRLTASARVEGDIIHKAIAIESGAHFEGTVQRADDPLGKNSKTSATRAKKTLGAAEAAGERVLASRD